MMKSGTAMILALLLLPAAHEAMATEALIAVATNFHGVAEELKAEFEADSDHRLRISAGSTGKLYAQILNGAPFDLFLAADEERPTLLEELGAAVDGTRFTYASGRLALWSPDAGRILDNVTTTVMQKDLRSLAIANPELAPYGVAAREALQSLGVWDAVRDRIVMGENVGQTFALVATGNAEIGFVAMSQVLYAKSRPSGSFVAVEPALHQPVRQGAVLLTHGADNDAARAFLDYLQSRGARALIRSRGYDSE